MSDEPTQFDYLLNAFEAASQADKPAARGYAEKRRLLFAHVRGLERENARLLAALRETTEWLHAKARVFWRYHSLHLEKGTDDGRAKAIDNKLHAEQCDQAVELARAVIASSEERKS